MKRVIAGIYACLSVLWASLNYAGQCDEAKQRICESPGSVSSLGWSVQWESVPPG